MSCCMQQLLQNYEAVYMEECYFLISPTIPREELCHWIVGFLSYVIALRMSQKITWPPHRHVDLPMKQGSFNSSANVNSITIFITQKFIVSFVACLMSIGSQLFREILQLINSTAVRNSNLMQICSKKYTWSSVVIPDEGASLSTMLYRISVSQSTVTSDNCSF